MSTDSQNLAPDSSNFSECSPPRVLILFELFKVSGNALDVWAQEGLKGCFEGGNLEELWNIRGGKFLNKGKPGKGVKTWKWP